MAKQYFTVCPRCGQQILMTYCEQNGKWVLCDPYLYRFRLSAGPGIYVTPEGDVVRGTHDRDGIFGYKKHRKDCDDGTICGAEPGRRMEPDED